MRRNAILELSVVSLMTSALGQSSNQGCREFLDVMGKSDQPAWLPPLTEISLSQVVPLLNSSLVTRCFAAVLDMHSCPLSMIVEACFSVE